MTAHAPISGTFPHYAARWVDPALGFAMGYTYWFKYIIGASDMTPIAFFIS